MPLGYGAVPNTKKDSAARPPSLFAQLWTLWICIPKAELEKQIQCECALAEIEGHIKEQLENEDVNQH